MPIVNNNPISWKSGLKYEYLLHTWGGFYNEEFKKIHGKEPGYYFFDSMEALKDYTKELRNLEQALNARSLVYNIQQGTMVRFRTIAKMNLIYKGKSYPYEYDFGFAYNPEGAIYMFEDGNYSCDCNLSNFIRRKYGNVIEELECGHEIEIRDLDVIQEFVPGQELIIKE